jgi:hypothetical protein
VGHSCAQQYQAHHHFLQDINEWDIVVLKFQTQYLGIEDASTFCFGLMEETI